MSRKKLGIPGLSFSWRRALGISQAQVPKWGKERNPTQSHPHEEKASREKRSREGDSAPLVLIHGGRIGVFLWGALATWWDGPET
jgi:hypothetical protein